MRMQVRQQLPGSGQLSTKQLNLPALTKGTRALINTHCRDMNVEPCTMYYRYRRPLCASRSLTSS